MLCVTSHARNPPRESLCGFTCSKRPHISLQLLCICTVLLGGLKARNTIQTIITFLTVSVKPSKRSQCQAVLCGCARLPSIFASVVLRIISPNLASTLPNITVPLSVACPISPVVRRNRTVHFLPNPFLLHTTDVSSNVVGKP
jgi:hypothetical protein